MEKSVKHAVNFIWVRCLQHEPWETFLIEFMIIGSMHVKRWAQKMSELLFIEALSLSLPH